MTTLGDLLYEDATPAAARLAGNTTTTKKFLTQTGTGSVSAPPAWGTLAVADFPIFVAAGTSNAAGAVPDPGGTSHSPVYFLGDDAVWHSQATITQLGTITVGTWNGTTVGVPYGGTGLASLTAHGVLVGEGTGNIAVTAAGATNTVLHGAGSGADPSFSAVVEGDLSLSDVTTANVSTSAHGFAPKAPNDATKYLDGTGSYSVPAGSTGAFIGQIATSALRTAPSKWLLCQGQLVSRTTYSTLFAAIVPLVGTCTITIASPAVVTLNGHGFVTGDSLYLTTTGSLPTGLTASTVRYYAIKIDANTFNLATSLANALAGTKINTSGSQSGTQSCYACPYGLGDGSTTFALPNLNGTVPLGTGASGQSGATTHLLGQTGGEETHLLSSSESGVPAHSHPITDQSHTHGPPGGGSGYWITQGGAVVAAGGSYAANNSYGSTGSSSTGITGTNTNTPANASSPHNTLPPYQVVNFIIYAGV